MDFWSPEFVLAQILLSSDAMGTPDIAVLWRKPDGTSCVLTKRGGTLFLSLQLAGQVRKEQAVESPREALDLATKWRSIGEA